MGDMHIYINAQKSKFDNAYCLMWICLNFLHLWLKFQILQCDITLALSRTFIKHWAVCRIFKGEVKSYI